MSWKQYSLGSILSRKKVVEKLSPNREYKLVTIKLYHKGVTLRKVVKGSEIGSSMCKINAGDFILSGIDARNGAFGIVPEELDGAIVTNDFWCLEPNEKIIDKEFLLYLTTTDFFDYICKQSSDGTTQRIRLQKDKFFNHKVNLPSIVEQKKVLGRLTKMDTVGFALSTELTTQQDLLTQLRQSFLREAMQGKLVKQDPKDGHAKDLLDKIKAAKATLRQAQGGKKEKELPPIKPEEIRFEIPENWVWCRLSEVGRITGGGTPSMSNPEFWNGNIPWVSPKDMGVEFISDTEMKVTKKGVEESTTNLIPTGSLLIVGRSGILKRKLPVAINRVECTVNQDIKVVIPYITLMNRFLQFMFNGMEHIILKDYVKFGMTVHSLRYAEFALMPIPLPPLKEQAKIVGKLEELMILCGSLQKSIQARREQNELLLQQVLKEALSSN